MSGSIYPKEVFDKELKRVEKDINLNYPAEELYIKSMAGVFCPDPKCGNEACYINNWIDHNSFTLKRSLYCRNHLNTFSNVKLGVISIRDNPTEEHLQKDIDSFNYLLKSRYQLKLKESSNGRKLVTKVSILSPEELYSKESPEKPSDCNCTSRDLLTFGHRCGRKAPIDY